MVGFISGRLAKLKVKSRFIRVERHVDPPYRLFGNMENIVVVNVPYVIVPSCQNCAIMSGRKAASRYTDPVQENNLSLAGTYALSSPLVPSIERNTSVDSQGRLLPNNLCTRRRNHFRNFIAPRWIPTSNQFSILATGWDSSARIRGHGTACRTVHP